MILSFWTVKLCFKKEFHAFVSGIRYTNFVKTGTKVNQLISMRIHFQTQKSWPIEFMDILHLLKVFSLVREWLKAGISSFKNLKLQIIIYFDSVISCISIDTPVKHHWKGVSLIKPSSWSLKYIMLGINRLLCSSWIQILDFWTIFFDK